VVLCCKLRQNHNIGDVINPLHTVLFSPGVYKAVFKIPLSDCSFWSTVSPQNLLFKAQDNVLGSGMRDRICFSHLVVASTIVSI